jgi:hypothetical protein
MSLGTTIACHVRMSRALSLWVGLGVTALLVAGCKFPFGEAPPCEANTNQPLDAGTVVMDPIVGTHDGRLTWIETGTTTDFTLTIDFDGPAFKTEGGCPGPYDVKVRYQVKSGDGLIGVTEEFEDYVDRTRRLYDSTGHLSGIDAAVLLTGGVAPDQPDLLNQTPIIDLELARDDAGFTTGTVRATTANQQITLGVIAFGDGS